MLDSDEVKRDSDPFAWVVAIIAGIFALWVEDKILHEVLNAFKMSFPNNPDVLTLILLIEGAVAIGAAIGVLSLFSRRKR